jgi:hypothetical protein
MDNLQQTLDKFAVPQPEQEELKTMVESTKEAIVVAPFDGGQRQQRATLNPPAEPT